MSEWKWDFDKGIITVVKGSNYGVSRSEILWFMRI